ncbi:DNA polymerase III PolC-type [Butyricicoccus faecihominis]|uniref:DNA polymerase III PolC-type n=1 Tax=Butyricicoccus faecihominis TaxID=1712515 RepID=A0ABQ1DZR5_9FIRM|nr:PolC-type DNA polymerase III [Butyricicoccus faecihominis]GFO88198.1 DNA polymerase III PolC-type [Butyricicoccus faecihominis]GGM62246.1 DNA polymerase III PolC-type [Butyricicoccus faecihominis]
MAGKLIDIFQNCKCVNEEKHLAAGEVRSLAFGDNNTVMVVELGLHEVVSRKVIAKAEKQIADTYGLDRVMIEPRYNMPGELSNAYIKSLYDDMAYRMPSAKGLLDHTKWEFADGALQIPMDEVSEKHFANALRHLEARIQRELGRSCPVHAVRADAQDFTPAPEQEESREEILHKAVEQAAAAAAETPKPKKPRPAPQQHTGYQRPRAEKVREDDLIFGKLIQDPIISVNEAIAAYDMVTIQGEVFFTDSKDIHSKKTGKDYVKIAFDMTDRTNSVRVSKFLAADKAGDTASKIKKGLYCTVQGKMVYDTFAKEMVLEPTGIVKAKKPERKDTYEGMKRVELHLHTNMSAMDGMSSTASLLCRAAKWGHRAMAITDHGVAQAFPEALHAQEGKQKDIIGDMKIIYGIEAYYINDENSISVVRGRSAEPLDGTFIVFDLETTGLNPASEEITEIAAVRVVEGEIRDSFQTYVNPHKPIPPEITELTGISDETVADAPDLDKAVPEFLKWAGEGQYPLVAHNAGFDMGFLRTACQRLGIEREFTSIDTLEMSRLMLPHMHKFKLNILAKELQVGPFEHHRASEDAAVLGRIYVKLLKRLREEMHAVTTADINPVLAATTDRKNKLKNLPRYHFIILVKNQAGLRNLYQLISKSFLEYYNKRPIMPRSELIRHREGLIFGSACEAGEVFRALTKGEPWEEIKRLASFYDYLEIQPIGNNNFMIAKGMAKDEEQLRDWNRDILRLADELGKPCCATGDVHFLEPEDEAFRRILMAGQGFSDADNQAPLYFKSTDEMLKEFSYLGEDRAYEVVVKNTNRIADMCDVIRPVPRENYPPHIDGCEDDLRNMCYEKAKRIYGDPLPEPVQARLDRELNSIIGNGYAVMYIIAQKLVTKSLADGYLVGSRGSVGSSLAAFMSDITEVNSLAPHYLCPDDKYLEWHEEYSCGVDLPDKICPNCGKPLTKQGFNIPFETFLGFEGDKVPDIDLNFAGEYQSRIHWYTGEIFGHDHVFRAGTIGTVAEKTAFGYVKKYMEERGIECSRAEENRLAAGCTGVRRTSGQHPGGVVVVPKEIEIYDVCPIQHPADDPDSDIITTHFEYHSIDANLLKLDELGHDDPTIIKHLENLTGVNAQEIPLDDPETMSLFHSCKALKYKGENPDTDPILGDLGCVAVPEFGTKFVRGMVKETHPSTFAELVSISGLSHGTDVWLGNAAELVRKGIPLSGCICCRDDIMNYLILQGVKPKLSFKTMESVRKGKGLTEEMEAAMNEQHVPEWYIDSCKKIKYMFPKAHAVAYVMMAFRIAWFKVHRPLAFYSAYFSIRAKGFDASCMIKGDKVCLDKMSELRQKERDKTISAAEKDMMTTLEVCHEFYRRGFTFEPMDVYKSDATRFLVTEIGLIPPFTSMPGIGEQAALSIVEERKNGKFLSAEELIVRCPKASKAVVELLEQIGALGSMPKTTQMTLF